MDSGSETSSGFDEKKKVLVIGLDGVTFDVLGPWIEQGELPTLKRLITQGVADELTSIIPPITAPSWASFASGKNPGKHGLIDFVFPRQGSYEISVTNSTHRDSKAVWNILSEQGKKVGVVNVPGSYPPEQVNGVFVTGVLTPPSSTRFTYPETLQYELEHKFGKLLLSPREGNRGRSAAKFVEDMIVFSEHQKKVACYIMDNYPWDFFIFVFYGTDTLQHELSYVFDDQHPWYNPDTVQDEKRLVLEFFKQIDQYIADLISRADEDTIIMVMSDHGFGPFHKFFHVNTWLFEEGWLHFKRDVRGSLKRLMFRFGVTPLSVLRVLTKFRLGGLRARAKFGHSKKLERQLFLSLADVDWSRTKAFGLGNFGQIYINRADKFPMGIVQPGVDYERTRDAIARAALDLRDPDTGEQVIAHAYKKEELYSGPNLEKLPDLIIHSRRSRYISFGEAEFGSNRVIETCYGQSGHHRMNGILIMAGQGIRRGTRLNGAKITDLAPTILYAMRIPIPRDMDGRVLREAFTPEFAEAAPLNYSEDPSLQEDYREGYSEEDEEQIKLRLTELGYIA